MFRAAYRSSSGALTVFAASGLHTHVVTGRSQVYVTWLRRSQFPLRLDYGRSPQAYVNQRLQIQLELLMISGMPLDTCWAFNERWNNEFYYKVASCWLFLLNLFYVYFCALKVHICLVHYTRIYPLHYILQSLSKHVSLYVKFMERVGRYHIFGTATPVALQSPGVQIQVRDEFFRTRSHWPKEPAKLLYKGYLVFTGDK
jgi:hypothetical protein